MKDVENSLEDWLQNAYLTSAQCVLAVLFLVGQTAYNTNPKGWKFKNGHYQCKQTHSKPKLHHLLDCYLDQLVWWSLFSMN